MNNKFKLTLFKEIIIGIDPGEKGGIAFISLDKSEYYVFSLSKEFFIIKEQIEHLNEIYEIKKVYIEKQHAFPNRGVVSTFNYGVHYGFLLGIIEMLRLEYELISYQKWKNFVIGKDIKFKTKKERKLYSIQKAKELFPNLEKEIGNHDGKAEALLIVYYGLNKYLKEVNNV